MKQLPQQKQLSKEAIQKAKEMDLLTYLKEFEPHELVYRGHNEYTTVTHRDTSCPKTKGFKR